jgi:cyanophycinase
MPVAIILLMLLACLGNHYASSLLAQSNRGSSKSVERNSDQLLSVFDTLLADSSQSVVQLHHEDKLIALGTVVGKDGFILTKASLLTEPFTCQLNDSSGKRFTGQVLQRDEQSDLALVKIDTTDLKPVQFGESKIKIASWVASMGPDGKTLSAGICSTEPRQIRLRESLDTRSKDRGFLGVMVQPAEAGGVEIVQVVENSAAEAAKLQVGDVILTADDAKLNVAQDLVGLLGAKKAGDQVQFELRRSPSSLQDDKRDNATEKEADDQSKSGDNQTDDRETAPEIIKIKLGKVPRELTESPFDRWGGGPFSERRFGFSETIVHDGVLKPNQCGGPLFDARGQFVGINIARAIRVSTYAIPAKDIQVLLEKWQTSIPAEVTQPQSLFDRHLLPNSTVDIDVNGIKGTVLLSSSEIFSEEDLQEMVRGFKPQKKADKVADKTADKIADKIADKKAEAEDIKSDRELNQAPAVFTILCCLSVESPPQIRSKLSEMCEAIQAEYGDALECNLIFLDEAAKQLPVTELTDSIATSRFVWCCGNARQLMLKALTDPNVREVCDQVFAAGGRIGGNRLFSQIAGTAFSGEPDQLEQGLGLIPQAVVFTDASRSNDFAFDASLPLFQIELKSDSRVAISGRRLYLLSGETRIAFPQTQHDVPFDSWLNAHHRFADLTALRRFALQRQSADFLAEAPKESIVENGTLIIVGGGGMPRGLLADFVELAGGKQAKIVVIPISMPDPLPDESRFIEQLKQLGAATVTVLTARTPQSVCAPESMDALRQATGIWFGGGRQWRFVDAYQGTEAEKLLHDVLKRGGVIAGSSAGASIQGEYMARGDPLGSEQIMALGYEQGMGFLPGVAIDQHFTQRNRLADLSSLVDRYPQLLGIGIDESTAIVVQKNIAKVVGKHRVCFYDRAQHRASDPDDFFSVANGGSFDLAKKRVIDAGELDAEDDAQTSEKKRPASEE